MAGSGLYAVVTGLATTPNSLLARMVVAGIGFVIIAAAFSAMTTGAIAFIGDVAPADRESELMGLRSTVKGVGGVLGPPIFGAVATVASYETAFLGGSVLAFAGRDSTGREQQRDPAGDCGRRLRNAPRPTQSHAVSMFQ
jgi:MFS family permease